MPERLECDVLQKARYINTLTYLPTFFTSPIHQQQYSFATALYANSIGKLNVRYSCN